MVPAAVTAIKNLSANDHNGIMTVHDMATKEYLKLYKEDKYWNLDLRDEFMHETRGLWHTTHADKYTGRIFQTRGPASKDMQVTMAKVDKEMAAAVAKHGEVTLPKSSHIEDFYARIEREKKNIVAQA